MKKPLTDAVTITFIGPATMIEQALAVMQTLGFEESKRAEVSQQSGNALSWCKTNYFKEIENKLPSVFLSGARHREGLTQVELAERSGIPRRHISEMENNKRPIGKMNARKLADVLNIDPRRLLSV